MALLVALASVGFATRHFVFKTDVNDLFSPGLPWAQRAFEYLRSFPQPDILVVV